MYDALNGMTGRRHKKKSNQLTNTIVDLFDDGTTDEITTELLHIAPALEGFVKCIEELEDSDDQSIKVMTRRKIK